MMAPWNELADIIDQAYDNREAAETEQWALAVETVFDALDCGAIAVAEKTDGQWQVNQWVKKAILLYFTAHQNAVIEAGQAASEHLGATWYDKIPAKTSGWQDKEWAQVGFRIVPGALVRKSAYIASGAVIMPSFINVGARIGKGTMIDTWATVGSCAQVGSDCHISGGAGIGGVLEPLQANPVIIEDDCFIGARSEVAEGVIVEQGSVLSMGVYIGASTKIIDRSTGAVHYGRVPAYSVVVPGTLPGQDGVPGLYCAVIVKKVDAKTRAKTAINQLLRDS